MFTSSISANRTASHEIPAHLVNDLYRHVGDRIRHRRSDLGLTQEQLAALVGVTIHSHDMHELGLARISGACLVAYAKALSVPLSWFFDTLSAQAIMAAVSQVEINPR